jgi:hypothetical protein
VHDLSAMDRSLLEAGAAARPPAKVARQADFLSQHIEKRAAAGEEEVLSVRAIREQQARTRQAADRQLADYLARGQAAEQAGRWDAARSHYTVVLRRGTGSLQQAARSRLAALPATR